MRFTASAGRISCGRRSVCRTGPPRAGSASSPGVELAGLEEVGDLDEIGELLAALLVHLLLEEPLGEPEPGLVHVGLEGRPGLAVELLRRELGDGAGDILAGQRLADALDLDDHLGVAVHDERPAVDRPVPHLDPAALAGRGVEQRDDVDHP
jgi:hypothetical protein